MLYTNRAEIMTRYDPVEEEDMEFFKDYRKLSSTASRISFLYEEYEPKVSLPLIPPSAVSLSLSLCVCSPLTLH